MRRNEYTVILRKKVKLHKKFRFFLNIVLNFCLGFFIIDEKLNFAKLSNKLMDIGVKRLVEHKVVQGRTGNNWYKICKTDPDLQKVLLGYGCCCVDS